MIHKITNSIREKQYEEEKEEEGEEEEEEERKKEENRILSRLEREATKNTQLTL